MNKTNIIIAVRDIDLRLSLDLLLRDEPYLNVLGTSSTLESTFGLTRIERPDLILLEWAMSNRPIEEMLKEIKDHSPNSKVILLGNSTNQETLDRREQLLGEIIDGSSPLDQELPGWVPPPTR